MVVMNNVTFKYVDGAPVGTLPEGKKAIICYSSAGTPVGGPVDFASGWLKHILGFIGIKDSTIVGVGCSAYPGQEDRDKQEEEQIAAL
jgi:FMN-dependent NADH-azoreductase